MRHFYFGLWLGAALVAAVGVASLASWLWPVTVYELFEVADGPFAPGHPGKAYLPTQRDPNLDEIQARLRVVVPSLIGGAALVLVWRVARGSGRSERFLTLESWNTSGLDAGNAAPARPGLRRGLEPPRTPPGSGA